MYLVGRMDGLLMLMLANIDDIDRCTMSGDWYGFHLSYLLRDLKDIFISVCFSSGFHFRTKSTYMFFCSHRKRIRDSNEKKIFRFLWSCRRMEIISIFRNFSCSSCLLRMCPFARRVSRISDAEQLMIWMRRACDCGRCYHVIHNAFNASIRTYTKKAFSTFLSLI